MKDQTNIISQEQQLTPNEKQLEQQPNKIQNQSDRTKSKLSKTHKISINLSDCQYPVLKLVAKILSWKVLIEPENSDWDVFWTDNAVLPETLLKMQQYQKINHFPGMYGLARKNLLGKGLMKMRKQFQQQYDFFPLTWLLPIQYSEFKHYYQSRPKGKTRTFIVKPQALSQGKGIFLTRRIQDIEPTGHFVVQRYLHKPYLIDGLKFDFRIYVLLAGVDPFRIYLYNQGLARFATQPYIVPTKQNMEDVCMHLTNYAINKDNPNFIFNKSQTDMSVGHKRSLTSVYQLLQKQGLDVKKLKKQIKNIVIKTLISGSSLLIQNYRSCQPQNFANNMCFQILGFDILLNSHGTPYLLQVNHTPSFTTDTPLDQLIKKNLIRDTLVLMNINQKIKSQLINTKKQAINQRVITGKKVKLSQQQKIKFKQQAQLKRDQFQNQHLGEFEKIYPCQDQQRLQKYKKMIQYNQKLYYQSTGINKKIKDIPKQQNVKLNKLQKVSISRSKPLIKTEQIKKQPENKNIENLKSIQQVKNMDNNKDIGKKYIQYKKIQQIDQKNSLINQVSITLPLLKINSENTTVPGETPKTAKQSNSQIKIFDKKSTKNIIQVKKIKQISKCQIFYKHQKTQKVQLAQNYERRQKQQKTQNQGKSIKPVNLNLFLSSQNKIKLDNGNRNAQISQSLQYKRKTPPLLTTLMNHNYMNLPNKSHNVVSNLRQFLKY